ncbi:MAG: MoaD/ThiS family protein [Actinobacteria bacterium]|nr:MoaD/ThiS family protein [Actinomycetota bacterium]MBU2689068.1 MoaD/ThiS family protein [Actinomycetota bacterium]
MEVEVRVATILMRKADPPLERSAFPYSLPEGTDVAGLIEALRIPPALVGSITVNKRRSPLDRTLSPGDDVAIVPAISGG